MSTPSTTRIAPFLLLAIGFIGTGAPAQLWKQIEHTTFDLPATIYGIPNPIGHLDNTPMVNPFPAEPAPEPAQASVEPSNQTALTQLNNLPVYDPAQAAQGYQRDAFASTWVDTDHNQCSTRNDILARDLTNTVTKRDGCTVIQGQLHDPYTGTIIHQDTTKQQSSPIDIDHVVAIKDAWESGAASWSQDQRVAFANDPDNLLAVSGSANRAKGDQSFDEWVPQNMAYRCEYAQKQVAVKARYNLGVTPREHAALAQTLSACTTAP